MKKKKENERKVIGNFSLHTQSFPVVDVVVVVVATHRLEILKSTVEICQTSSPASETVEYQQCMLTHVKRSSRRWLHSCT